MAVTKIHAIKSTLNKALAYIENPEKTEGQLLVSGYNVEPQTAALEFEMTATLARKIRFSAGKSKNLAYHLIQSFSPDDEVTPEQAHEIGKKLTSEFTGGRFEYVIATHVDKGHLHNHIIINAVSYLDYKKMRTVPYRTAGQIRGISDRLCAEAELSVIDSPQQLGQQYSDYIKKRKQTPVRTEIRRRLNFCLDRATDYQQFKNMAAELGIQIKDGGKYVSYRYEGAGKPVRDNKLADTDKYTVNGIKSCLESNLLAVERIRAVAAAIDPQTTLEQRQEILKQAGIQTKTNRRTGTVSYQVESADGDWLPEDALAKVNETTSTVLERYMATVRTSPDTQNALITLSPNQIMNGTTAGLVVRTRDKNGNAVALMVEHEMVEATPDGKVQIAVGSQFSYDIVYEDGIHGTMRGGEIIRQIEIENGVRPLSARLTASQIKCMSLRGVTITLPDAGIERAFIPAEYVHYDKIAGTCSVDIYKNWDYSYVPSTAPSGDRKNIKGQNFIDLLSKSGEVSVDGSLHLRIMYVTRKASLANTRRLADTLLHMSRSQMHTAKDFVPQLRTLRKERDEVTAQLQLEKTNKEHYAIAAKCLTLCQTHKGLWQQYMSTPAIFKKIFWAKHKELLKAYQVAIQQLENYDVRPDVDPDKVLSLIRDRERCIADLEKRLASLTEQERNLVAQQETVANIQARNQQHIDTEKDDKDDHAI